jgi:hypothetical protein
MTMETPISVAQHQRHLWDDPPVPRRQVDFIELHQGGIKRCQPLPEMFKKNNRTLPIRYHYKILLFGDGVYNPLESSGDLKDGLLLVLSHKIKIKTSKHSKMITIVLK